MIIQGRERILVSRYGAMGDVLQVTPIARRMREENPRALIEVETHHSNVFRDNPDAYSVGQRTGNYSRFIDLNMAYEGHLRNKHPVDCYSLIAFGDEKTPLSLTLVFDPNPPDLGIDYEKTIAIHPARSWPQRTLPIEFWRKLVAILKERGWNVVSLGTSQDHDIDGMGVANTRNQLSLAQQASVINACASFICSDSGLMAVAHTTKTPIVPLLTMTLPYMAEHERFGKMGWGFHPITADIHCVGCTHEQKEPNTFFPCKWQGTSDENRCVTRFIPTTVAWKAIAVARQYQERRNNAVA